jgi:HEPN domain-containing protein
MGQLTRDCPHYHTKNVSFTSFGYFKVPDTIDFITAFYCGGCYGGYIARIYSRVSTNAHGFNGNIDANNNYIIREEYPLPLEISSPKHLPENLDKFYLQAANSLRAGNHDASAMMSRKVLEVAVKTLSPDGEGSLYHRIENLATDGKITPELKDWAHIIRDDGNEAAHEEEPVSTKFAIELLSFAEMFLMYTFTMPGMIADRRPAADENSA